MTNIELDPGRKSRFNSLDALAKIGMETAYCECANIGSRALANGYMPLARRITNGFELFEKKNLKAEHQHIIFTQSLDNIGLMGSSGQAELFSEDITNQTYHYGSKECFDGSLMRKAVQATGIPKAYQWLGYNCQSYIETVKAKYLEFRDGVLGGSCRVVGG